MRNIITFLMLLIQIESFGQKSDIYIDSQIDTIFTCSIKEDASNYHILSNNWFVQYQRANEYTISIKEAGTYVFEIICEQEELGISLVDSLHDIVEVGSQPKTRFHKRIISKQLELGNYKLIVGSGTSEGNIEVKVAIHTKDKKVMWRSSEFEKLKLLNYKTSDKIDSLTPIFEGNNAFMYSLQHDNNKNVWYKVICSSKDFEPFIITLDKSDEVNKVEYFQSSNKKNPEIIINPTDSINYLLISSKKIFSFKNKAFYLFNLIIKEYSYDPSKSLFEITKSKLTPLNTFIIGIIFAFLMSYYFYVKATKSRKFVHWEVSDNDLLSQEEGQKDHLLKIGDKSTYCASHYKYQFENVGRKRIQGSQIIKDIELELTNIDDILDVNFRNQGEGWLIPEQINKNTFKVSFDYVDPKDFITLSVICSIENEEQEKKGIIPIVRGYISETVFFEKTHKPRSILNLILHFTNILNILIILPIVLIADYLNLSLPYWYDNFLSYFFPFSLFIFYLYLLTIGRAYIINSPKILWFYLKRIIKTTTNTRS